MTLKAFKAMFTVGTRFLVVDHWIDRYRGSVRTVTKSGGVGYRFTDDQDSKTNHGVHPKASELTFNPDGSVTVRPKALEAKGVFWTLKLVGEVVPVAPPAPVVEKPAPSPLTKEEAFRAAKHGARYVHGDWFVWCDKAGGWHGDKGTPSNYTRAAGEVDPGSKVFSIGEGSPYFCRHQALIVEMWARSAQYA